jgi:hypothetical protein
MRRRRLVPPLPLGCPPRRGTRRTWPVPVAGRRPYRRNTALRDTALRDTALRDTALRDTARRNATGRNGSLRTRPPSGLRRSRCGRPAASRLWRPSGTRVESFSHPGPVSRTRPLHGRCLTQSVPGTLPFPGPGRFRGPPPSGPATDKPEQHQHHDSENEPDARKIQPEPHQARIGVPGDKPGDHQEHASHQHHGAQCRRGDDYPRPASRGLIRAHRSTIASRYVSRKPYAQERG